MYAAYHVTCFSSLCKPEHVSSFSSSILIVVAILYKPGFHYIDEDLSRAIHSLLLISSFDSTFMFEFNPYCQLSSAQRSYERNKERAGCKAQKLLECKSPHFWHL